MADHVVEIKDRRNDDGQTLFSISRLGREFGMHRQTVRKRLDGVPPDVTAGGNPLYTIATAAPYLIEVQRTEMDPDKLPPFDRHQYYASELKRLKLEIDQGRVIPVEQIRRELAELFGQVASTLETLPDLLESKGLPRDLIGVAQEVVDGLRGRLYLDLVDEEESAEAAGDA